ncbi:MAG: thiamine-phosphate kinase [Methylophilaceae bacterium]|jgi:thiamine-monophosphate kinase|nr:thiamine-phosphate kinase [Methylophilaceae bacterium]
MTSEFNLIERFFTKPTPQAVLGVGDDAALMAVSPNMELAVSTDMLVSGTHFFPDADPRKLGWKALAVNVSDMAAMGAQPRWATLAIALPRADEPWLSAFAGGFFACAKEFGIDLVGGDTTRGPLNLAVTIFGEIPRGQALRRSGAQPDDDIWVSGTLGGAALALNALQGKVELAEDDVNACRRLLDTPQPRVELGLALRGIATSALDISDGLLGDLGHILERSNVGAELCFDALPSHPALEPLLANEWAQRCLLSGGDDYELCFTAPRTRHDAIKTLEDRLGLKLSRIGKITADSGLQLLDAAGQPMAQPGSGYDHFA